jgi:hypothetical protein
MRLARHPDPSPGERGDQDTLEGKWKLPKEVRRKLNKRSVLPAKPASAYKAQKPEAECSKSQCLKKQDWAGHSGSSLLS